jgi:hypothetical protein
MKELIIIIFKINVQGLSSQRAKEVIYDMMTRYSFKDDEELKERYMIRSIFMPTVTESSDVKVVYPSPKYVPASKLNEVTFDEEITSKIEECNTIIKSLTEKD